MDFLMNEPALPFVLAGILFALVSPKLGLAITLFLGFWIVFSELKGGLNL